MGDRSVKGEADADVKDPQCPLLAVLHQYYSFLLQKNLIAFQ